MTADEREEVLVRIFELTESRGIELVVLIPVYRGFHDHRDLLAEVSVRLEIDCLDLETVIERSHTSRKDLFLDEVHPTAKMHRFIGEEICRYLRSRVLPSLTRIRPAEWPPQGVAGAQDSSGKMVRYLSKFF